MNNVSIVIFGATGDLAKRKLVPALVNLHKKGKMSNESAIVAVGRRDLDDGKYKEFLINGTKDKKIIEGIKRLNIRYFKGDISKENGLNGLDDFLKEVENGKDHKRIYYFATSYEFFSNITTNLKRLGLDSEKDRVIFEKPFGNDLESSEKLDKEIKSVFTEEQIFRIDHYLAKETVRNIEVLRFTNPIFDSVLNNRMVESIEIVLDEDLDVGERIEYYNDAGAIKDMMQSHMLQVLSLLLMNKPRDFSSDSIHDEKVKALRAIKLEKAENCLLGQYRSYKEEAKKANISNYDKTETFAKIMLECDNERWNGTKIMLRTGKKLGRKYSQIRINFKHIDKKVIEAFRGAEDNRIIIDIYPKQDVKIYMNHRKPGEKELEKVEFEFCHEEHFGPNTSDEYAVLLEDAIEGNKILFTRFDELQESWKIVDKIEKEKDKMKFIVYDDGSDPEKQRDTKLLL